MKFVTYEKDGVRRVGRLADDTVVDVGFEGDMVAFIEAGGPVGSERAVDGARLVAPLRPRSLRDFISFESHLQNSFSRLGLTIAEEWYQVPAYYKGMPDTVIGPDDEVPWPHYVGMLDHELELAAIIGKPGKDLSKENAGGHIFGYTIWNDISARDVQQPEMKIGMGPGKSKDWDGSNVLGPCIVTADEFDATNARMTVTTDGEVWGEDNSGSMYRTFEDLLVYCSQAQTLYPGEVFGSGTSGGGSGFDLDRWLKGGELVELEIEGIGVLRNRIGQRAAERARGEPRAGQEL